MGNKSPSILDLITAATCIIEDQSLSYVDKGDMVLASGEMEDMDISRKTMRRHLLAGLAVDD